MLRKVKSGIQYLWQGEMGVCKVMVPIKVVPVKNDHLLHQKFQLYKYYLMNEFPYRRSFYWKNILVTNSLSR